MKRGTNELDPGNSIPSQGMNLRSARGKGSHQASPNKSSVARVAVARLCLSPIGIIRAAEQDRDIAHVDLCHASPSSLVLLDVPFTLTDISRAPDLYVLRTTSSSEADPDLNPAGHKLVGVYVCRLRNTASQCQQRFTYQLREGSFEGRNECFEERDASRDLLS